MNKRIIISYMGHSAGSSDFLDMACKAIGEEGIVYHRVILNGCRLNESGYSSVYDGFLDWGKTIDRDGDDPISICLVAKGPRQVTYLQVATLIHELIVLCSEYSIPTENIYFNHELSEKGQMPDQSHSKKIQAILSTFLHRIRGQVISDACFTGD